MEAITSVSTHLEILQKYGVAVYLSLFFSIGIFIFSVLLIRRLLNMYEAEKKQSLATQEKEREGHQQFLSEAVKGNTTALIIATDRLSDLGAMLKSISECLVRLESANKYQREEHVLQAQLLKDMDYSLRNMSK